MTQLRARLEQRTAGAHRPAAAAAAEPLWAEGAGHQDLEAHPQFVPTLRRFLKECWGEEYDKGA
jgi:hypothetical protein